MDSAYEYTDPVPPQQHRKWFTGLFGKDEVGDNDKQRAVLEVQRMIDMRTQNIVRKM